MARLTHKEATNLQKIILDWIYSNTLKLLAWFLPRFRKGTGGAEAIISKLINDVRGKRDLGKRNPEAKSTFLQDIRDHSEEVRKDGGAIHD